MNNLIKKIWLVFAILIIIVALISSLFRALTPWATEYKGEVEQRLSTMLGKPVTIKTMETGWYWFNPVIKLGSVSIQDDQNHPILLDKILVGFNVLGSLWNWQIEPGILYIDQVHLDFQREQDSWHLKGFSQAAGQMNNLSSTMSPQILMWLSQQDKLIIRNVSADFHKDNNNTVYLRNINLVLARTGMHYRLRGKAKLLHSAAKNAEATDLRLMADMALNVRALDKAKGQVYLAANNAQFSQAQFILPELAEYTEGGNGDLELWFDIAKGQLASAQSKLRLNDLVITKQKIDSFTANMAWQVLADGWNFSADQLKMQINGEVWPENTMFVHYDKSSKMYFSYLKSLIIKQLYALKLDAIQNMPLMMNAKLEGNLTDLQIKIESGQLSSLLTRFDNLSWKAFDNIPKVNNLSGVVQYQPDSGRVELDTEQSSIKIKGYPEQHFALINAALAWKLAENQKGHIDIERLELSQPDVALSALGNLDWDKNTIGNIQLGVDFSANHLEQWIKYLPAQWLKPSFHLWLKNDVKYISKASGRVDIVGQGADFPFDNSPGEFKLTSRISGLDLRVNKDWPYVRDGEIYLDMNKRNLQIDVIQAKLDDAQINSMHLRIDDIGKDRETLIIDTKIVDQAKNLLEYIQQSPVAKKISLLKKIRLDGLLTTILHIEAPLYPEKDDITVKGNLIFDKNILHINYGLHQIKVDELIGNLPFTDEALQPSSLEALLFDSPITIDISLPKSSQTLVDLRGEIPIESLKNQFKSSAWSLFSGDFSAQLRFIINRSLLDKIQLTTNLQGASIALPAPFGKSKKASLPLDIELSFQANNSMKVEAQYADLLRSELLFGLGSETANFQSGLLRIGKTHATKENLSGLQVVGSLEHFDLNEWQKALLKISSGDENKNWMKDLRFVNLFFDKFTGFGRDIKALSLKLTPQKNGDWGLKIKQEHVQADLIYSLKANNLSGHISQIHLEKNTKFESDENKINLRPEQIPNLNLIIDSLQLGNMKIGSLTLATKSSPSLLELSYCKIQAPGYTMDLQGRWRQENKRNKTEIQGSLILKNLAKTLELWAIEPAIDASNGEAQFKVYWPAAIYDFSLAKMSGELSMSLKHGRITDLSPETEQKLGLGKLLSILSLQTLPRRLTLDFSDLAQNGYSFDVFKGNFILTKGILNTKDSYIDGPVAYASMKGDLDLVQRLYDLELGISPHVAASLPVVATIAGGPIAGAAAWVVGKIINQGMHKVTAYSYKISGPWSHPVVQQISIIKNKITR